MGFYLATSNTGKFREINALGKDYNINFLTLPNDIIPPNEPYITFVENALHKARYYSRHLNAPVVAEDSGLCVPVLQDAPGVFSARYAQVNTSNPTSSVSLSSESKDQENNRALLLALQNHSDRRAFYVCYAVALRNANDPSPLITQGFWHGTIAKSSSGEHGFGYDPIFEIEESHSGRYKTVAELNLHEKQALSHRSIAFRALLSLIKQHHNEPAPTHRMK